MLKKRLERYSNQIKTFGVSPYDRRDYNSLFKVKI